MEKRQPMHTFPMGPLQLHAKIERWPLRTAFRISGHVWESLEVLIVSLEKDGENGRGEAAGVYYKNDAPTQMLKTIEQLRCTIEAGVDRNSVQGLLPAGGARNALDCALWDLEAKLTHRAAWQIAELTEPHALLTSFTCGAEQPDKMAAVAREYKNAKAIKLKLTGEPIDSDRVRAVREARADVWLGVDANQGLTRASLEKLLPVLIEADVALIEQPFPIGDDALLDDFQSPIAIAADESAQSLIDIPRLVGRYGVVNIKLDKCGGLTEGLAMARAAKNLGLEPMVGNMIGTSLAMAPAFILGQLCKVVDLDGPVFLSSDRQLGIQYRDGMIACPESFWGGSGTV